MKPRPLNLAAGVSRLLALAIIVLWVRSHWRRESIGSSWHTSTEVYGCVIGSSYGSLDFEFKHDVDTGPRVVPRYFEYFDYTLYDSKRPRKLIHWFPFPPVRFQHLSSPAYWMLDLAYWLLLPPTLILPTIAFARHRRRRHRETNNLCPSCGYDLRATPAKSGPLFDRCPECGTSIQSTRGSCATQS